MKSFVAGLALLAGLLVPAVPAGAADGCDGRPLGQLLDCLFTGPGAVQNNNHVVGAPLTGEVKITPELRLKERREVFAQRALHVSVPKGVTTGEGGTILLILAGVRRVDPDAMITRLSSDVTNALAQFEACPTGRLCEVLTGALPIPGRELIAERLALDVNTAPAPTPVLPTGPEGTVKPGDPDGGLGTYTMVLLAVALGLAGVLAFAAWRRLAKEASTPVPPATRHDLPGVPSPAPPPTVPIGGHRARRADVQPSGRRRRATVRTDLHPQGYVELDRDLYRAAWADPETPPPREGHPVDVVSDPDSGVLLAYPPGY